MCETKSIFENEFKLIFLKMSGYLIVGSLFLKYVIIKIYTFPTDF